SARVPAWDQVRPARYHRASSDQLTTHGLVIEPFALFLAARSLRITLSQQLLKRIARPLQWLHDQPATSHRKAHLRSRPQVQDIEERGRYRQHDRAADLA